MWPNFPNDRYLWLRGPLKEGHGISFDGQKPTKSIAGGLGIIREHGPKRNPDDRTEYVKVKR